MENIPDKKSNKRADRKSNKKKNPDKKPIKPHIVWQGVSLPAHKLDSVKQHAM